MRASFAFSCSVVKVDPHGDRTLSFAIVDDPPAGDSTDSERYRLYRYNRALHRGLKARGHKETEKTGFYTGVFMADAVTLDTGSMKRVTKAFDNSKSGSAMFPFPGTLKVRQAS
jgi:hypothetical protein